jgi:hypothetical protein
LPNRNLGVKLLRPTRAEGSESVPDLAGQVILTTKQVKYLFLKPLLKTTVRHIPQVEVIVYTPCTKHRVSLVGVLGIDFLDNEAVLVWVYDIVFVLTNPHITCRRFVTLIVKERHRLKAVRLVRLKLKGIVTHTKCVRVYSTNSISNHIITSILVPPPTSK